RRAGIAYAGENVPGGGNGEEEQQSGEEMELAPAPPLSGQRQIGDEGDANDDQCHQSLGKHRKRKQRVSGIPGPARAGNIQGGDQAVESRGDEEAENRLRDEDAGKEKVADAGSD